MNNEDFPSANNQNARFRSMYRDRDENGESDECVMIHIPMIQTLIEKFARDIWKLGLNHPDYVIIDYQMCLWIYNRINRPREKVIELLSASLDCNPILLHNDTEFIEYLKKIETNSENI